MTNFILFKCHKILLQVKGVNMKKKLQDIAEINAGLVLARRRSESGTHTYRVLQYKNMQSSGILTFDNNNEDYLFRSDEPIPDKYLTKAKDIVLGGKLPITAAYITARCENLVVNSNFIVLNVKNSEIDPKFLAWYLNSSNGLRQLNRDTRASSVIAGINIKSISEIEIDFPSIKVQKTIGDAYIAFNELEIDKINLINKERQYLSQILNTAYNTSITK